MVDNVCNQDSEWLRITDDRQCVYSGLCLKLRLNIKPELILVTFVGIRELGSWYQCLFMSYTKLKPQLAVFTDVMDSMMSSNSSQT